MNWLDWCKFHAELLGGITLAAVLFTLAGLAAIPWVLVRLPADHFVRPESELLPSPLAGWGTWLWWGVRNLLGLVLLIAGMLMILLPGPGLLAILLSLSLLNFPGRRALERRLINLRPVHENINRFRAKYGAEPLQLPGNV